jgi:hypothetical protein
MANLLSKFRIDYSDLIMIREITRKPQDSSKAFFKHLIQDLRAPKGIPVDDGTYYSFSQQFRKRKIDSKFIRLYN